MAKGLIKKSPPSPEQARASIEKAKIMLMEAKADMADERFNSTVMIAYAAILNASRAILFRDGFRERSHACVVRYLESNYKSKISRDTIRLLDHFRETRHEVQYEASYLADAESASQIMEFAEKFIVQMEGILS